MSAQAAAAKRELLERQARVKMMRSELHRKQREVIDLMLGGQQYIACICGRRAGKTEMDARAIAIALERCRADEWVIYAAVTRGLAKDLIWARLSGLNERYELGWRMSEHEGLVTTQRGGKFRVLGFDKLPEIQKIRGYKVRLIVFDEPSTYSDKLEALIRDCVGPALGDLRGTLLINGTPGEVCAGFWYEASTGKRQRYATRKWTVLDNPKFPRDAHEMLREERVENGWDEENASYQREWMGNWVDDPEAQVYKYLESRNMVDAMPSDFPGFSDGDWFCTMGFDGGYSPDPCAWTVLASSRHSRDTYIVHAEEQFELLPDEAAAVTRSLVERFKPVAVVGDPAAANYLAEWNRRWAEKAGVWIELADKLDKEGAIEIFNGELRSGRMKVLAGTGTETWRDQATHLPWKILPGGGRMEHPGRAQHTLDAGLYSYRRHRSYRGVEPKPAPTPDVAAQLAQWERIDRVQGELRRARSDYEDY